MEALEGFRPGNQARLRCPTVEGGLFDQWRQSTVAIRSLAHLSTAVDGAAGRSRRRRVVALVLSLSGDVVLGLRAGTPKRRRDLECLINVLDAAMWASLVRDAPAFVRPPVVATLVPTAIETGFRLGAGTTAVPVMEPARPWRAAVERRSGVSGLLRLRVVPDRSWELVTEVGRDVLPPLIAMWWARWRRGTRLGPGPLGWVVFSAVGGYALARSREEAQRAMAATWAERTGSIVEEAMVGSRVHAALVHNNAGVDPKSMLTHLALAGSSRAAAALESIRSGHVDLVRRFQSEGTLLSDAVGRRPVEPVRDATRWIENAQVRQLRQAIEEIDDALEETLPDEEEAFDDTVEVLSARGPTLALRYREHAIDLQRLPPELMVRLDPTVPSILLGSVWAGLSISPALGAAPAWAVVPGVGLQLAAVARLRRRPLEAQRADPMTGWLVAAGSAVIDVAIGARQRVLQGPDGFGLCPGTGATQSLVILIAANWRDLDRHRIPLMIAAGLGWTIAYRAPGRRPMRTAVGELAFLLMPAIATATIGADARREAEALDDHLEGQLAIRVEEAAREAARSELAAFVDQVRTVLHELETGPPGLDPDDVVSLIATYRAELSRLATTDPLAIVNW